MASARATMSTMATEAGSTAGHLTHGMDATLSTVAVATVSPHPGGGTGMDMNTVAMCVAVLLLTLVALIVHLHASRLRPLLLLTARPARAPVASGRRPEPPNLYALSVQRC